MTKTYQKTITLSDGNNTVTLGGQQVKRNLNEKLNESNMPSEQDGQKKTLALPLNQITDTLKINAVADDIIAMELNTGFQDKEELNDALLALKLSLSVKGLQYGNKSFTGYINQLQIQEQSNQDNSQYNYTFNFLVSESMRSE